MLECIKKKYYVEETMALLKETITAVLESASRVCTFEAHEDVKKELCSYFNESSELYIGVDKYFMDCFGRSFGCKEHEAMKEIMVFKP